MPSTATMTDADLSAVLKSGLSKLAPKDRPFAQSLADNVARYGRATPKQRPWLQKLADRVLSGNAEPERTKTPVGDLGGIMRLFDKALQHAKAPAVVIDIGGQTIRLSIANERARNPGTVNVASTGSFENRTWFGRILKDGQFEASPRAETPAGLIAGLQRFAADPAGVAAEYGRLTSHCSFCRKPLTDERSVFAGYGETCASNYDLPWGDRPAGGFFADAAE